MMKPILIVEDDPMIAMDLETIASDAGVVPVCCGILREAVRAADLADDALALLDINLPDGTTFALARQLAARGVPVMFISAIRKAEIPAELAAARLLPKPFRAAEVKAVISAAT